MRPETAAFQMDFNGARPPHGPHGYVLDTQIGLGGEGVVYKGHKRGADEQIAAIKISFPDENRSVDRLMDEATKIEAMDHEGIVKALWHGKHLEGSSKKPNRTRNPQTFPYVVTEFMDGGTLEDRLQQVMPTKHIISALAQVLAGVSHAHGEGRGDECERIVHRDLKPSNVLFSTQQPAPHIDGFPDFTDTERAAITDFGIAIAAPGRRINGKLVTVTKTQVISGTYQFTPKEQFYGKAEPRSDDYAIAVMAYRMITGQYPIDIGDTGSLSKEAELLHWVQAHSEASIRPFAEVSPHRMNAVLEAVEDPIRRSLRKSPEDRYSSTGELLEAVRVAVDKGLRVHRQAIARIDMKVSALPKGATEAWPQSEAEEQAIQAATEAAEQEEAKGTKLLLHIPTNDGPGVKEDIGTKVEPKKISRRLVLSSLAGLGLAGTVGTLAALRVLNPPEETGPEARAERQVIVDTAKQVLEAMEARGMADKTAFLLRNLIHYETKFVVDKVLQRQEANDPKAAWLAAELTHYLPDEAAKIMNLYKEKGQYDNMMIVAASLQAVAQANLPTSTNASNPYQQASSAVSEVISVCWQKDLLYHKRTIEVAPGSVTARFAGQYSVTTASEVLTELEKAKQFTHVRALGVALASMKEVNRRVVSDLITHYDERAQVSPDLASELYLLVAHLSATLAEYGHDAAKAAGAELLRMGDRSDGLADETSWNLAIQIAPYNPDAVLQYMASREGQTAARMAAVALAYARPEQIKPLLPSLEEPVKSWVNASLNTMDGHSPADAVRILTDNADMLENFGPEMGAAFLLSRRVR